MNEQTRPYALGSSDHEIERLDRQSESIEAATRMLLRASGILPGMRVLDLGTGIGRVAMLIAEMVGPEGRWPKRAWPTCRVLACRHTSHPATRAGRRC